MKKFTFLIIIGILFILIGCATTQEIRKLPREEQDKIITRTFEHEYNKVFSAVIDTLDSIGYTINETNMDAGLIVTDWRYEETTSKTIIRAAVAGIGRSRAKVTARIYKKSENETKVKLTFVLEYYTEFGWMTQNLRNDEETREVYNKFFTKIEEYCSQN